jgi:hypothetical protein
MLEKTGPHADILLVDAEVLTEPVYLANPCTVVVHVTNRGDQRVQINGRLAVGYRDSDERELFVDVYEAGSATVVGKRSLLYERAPATPDDYVWLGPGDSASTTFNLFEWYELPGPGDYELVVYYQPGVPPAADSAGPQTATYASERVSFTVRP